MNKNKGTEAASTEELIHIMDDYSTEDKSKPRKRITKEELSKHRITSDSNIPDPDPVITIGEANFAIRGDISFISGQPKAGKTTVCSLIITTALMEKLPPDLDTLGIRTQFCNGCEVIYVDTEQPKQYAKKMLETVKNYMNVFREPQNFHFYNLRDYMNTEKFSMVKGMFEQFPKAHLWIIDGVADLMTNINNEEQTSEVISWFMAAASKHNTTIVLVLHENPGTEKMRGHLGSEASRKAGGAIAIKKDRQKKCHMIESRIIRGSADFDTIYFEYDKTLGRMVSLNGTAPKSTPIEDPKEHLVKIARQCLVNGSETLDKKELLSRIMLYYAYPAKTVERTARRKFNDMLELNIICQGGDTKYFLVNDKPVVKNPTDKEKDSKNDETNEVPF